MNVALTQTFADLTRTLTGHRRIEQDVRVVVSTYGSMGARFIVLVTPAGAERGEYFEVLNRRTLDMLMEGRFTPEDLELSIAEGVE